MVAVWTRVRLSQWGSWCRGRLPTGYPTASAFVHANEGARCRDEGTMPAELAEVERAVAALRQELRQATIAGYVWRGPWRERAGRIGVSAATLRRHLVRAEAQVERILQLAD